MSEASDRFWRDLWQLKEGRGGRGSWAIVPKPDFTRTMAVGEKAKDIVIPYAVDEGESTGQSQRTDMQHRLRHELDVWPPSTWIQQSPIP